VTERATRVLLAAAHPLLRAGLRATLVEAPDLHVVGEAGDGEQAVLLAHRLLPDVLLLDATLPRLAGLEQLTGALAGVGGAGSRVLVLADTATDTSVVTALRGGAAGVLAPDSPADDLVNAVRAVAGGGAAVSPLALRRLLAQMLPLLPEQEAPLPAPTAVLTERERQVLVEVAHGHSNTEIAALLAVSETTVKTHIGHVLTKLRLRDRVQAVVFAYESGLVRPAGRTNEIIG